MRTYNELLLENIEQKKLKRLQLEEASDRSQAPRFDQIAMALDEYYFINQIQIYCAYLSYRQMVRSELLDYDEQAFRLIGPIIKCIETEEFSNPFLEIYNHIRVLLENKQLSEIRFNELFNHTLTLIQSQTDSAYTKIKLDALSFLSNLSIRKINEGQQQFAESLFEVNNAILNLRFGSAGSNRYKLPVSLFKNMVVTCFKIKDADFFKKINTIHIFPRNENIGFKNASEWASAFVAHYKKRLIKKEAKKYTFFCEAYIEFKNENFIKAYRILNNPIRLRGMFINMNIRQLHLQILFELQLSDPSILDKDDVNIKTYCESLRKLIADDKMRKKQLSYHAGYFESYEKLYRHLIRLYFKYRLPYMTKGATYEKEMNRLQEEISNCIYSYKEWFEAKYLRIKQAH